MDSQQSLLHIQLATAEKGLALCKKRVAAAEEQGVPLETLAELQEKADEACEMVLQCEDDLQELGDKARAAGSPGSCDAATS